MPANVVPSGHPTTSAYKERTTTRLASRKCKYGSVLRECRCTCCPRRRASHVWLLRPAAAAAAELHLPAGESLRLPLAGGQGHLVWRPYRRRPRRQRWCLRLQACEPVPVHVHGVVRQRAPLQGRHGMRSLLPDTMRQQSCLLRQAGDGHDHGHELLPRGQVPLRPQRHGLRRHGQARPERQAPPRRHNRHPVQEGAMQAPGLDGDLPRAAGLQPELPRRAGGVRQPGRHRGADGAHAVQERPPDGVLGAHDPFLGRHLQEGHEPPAAGALLAPHPQRVRQDAGGQPGHPGQLEARHRLPLQRTVPLIAPPADA